MTNATQTFTAPAKPFTEDDAPGVDEIDEAMGGPAKTAEVCECGAAMGERCAGTLGADAVEIEWMPEHLRASHVAACNRGSYPANGALRLRVTPACAALLLDTDDEWTERV